jgi:hypothetical protein
VRQGPGVMAEWDRLAFNHGTPAGSGQDARELTTVRHVVHVPAARRIVEDGSIKAGLIYDESKLNQTRQSVVWLSANTWAYGSIYGTVEFQFDWLGILGDRQIYWVEAMYKYNPPAFRFLLSKSPSSAALVTPYDPSREDGPLKLHGGKWFWNGRYTSEFMVDEDLDLDRCTSVDFVRHRDPYCRLNGSGCPEIGHAPFVSGGKVLAGILGNDLRGVDRQISPTKASPDGRHDLFDHAYSGLWIALTGKTNFGGALCNPQSCLSATQGALSLYAAGDIEGARRLLSLIRTERDFGRALRKLVRRHFSIPKWKQQQG